MAALSATVYGFLTKTGTQTNGRFGTADITLDDGTDNVIYQVPAVDVDYAILNVSLCNRDTSSLTNINIAISNSTSPNDEEFVEWNATVAPSGVLERTQLFVAPAQYVIVRVGTPAP